MLQPLTYSAGVFGYNPNYLETDAIFETSPICKILSLSQANYPRDEMGLAPISTFIAPARR